MPIANTCDRYACEVHVLMFKHTPVWRAAAAECGAAPAKRGAAAVCGSGRVSASASASGREDDADVNVAVDVGSHAQVKSKMTKSAELFSNTDEVVLQIEEPPSDDDESTCASAASRASPSIRALEKYEEPLGGMLARVPLNEAGDPTSIGSVKHEMGDCRPCAFFGSDEKPCLNGIRCRYCHFPHVKRSKGKVRPHQRRRLEIRTAVETAVANAGNDGIMPPPRYIPISWSRKPLEHERDSGAGPRIRNEAN